MQANRTCRSRHGAIQIPFKISLEGNGEIGRRRRSYIAGFIRRGEAAVISSLLPSGLLSSGMCGTFLTADGLLKSFLCARQKV